MKIFTILLLIGFFSANLSSAQVMYATTVTGNKVVLYPDGSWVKEEPVTGLNDCSTWIDKTIDKDGTIKLMLKESIDIMVNESGFHIYMSGNSKGHHMLNIQAIGAGDCIEEGSPIQITFTDGSKVYLVTSGKLNCKGEAIVYMGGEYGKQNELEALKTKRIQTLKVHTNDGFVEKNFTPAHQDLFYNLINCIAMN